MRRIVAAFTAFCGLVFYGLGCGILGPDLDDEGTIGYSDVEGGCWSIVTSKEHFEPVNLPDSLKVEGLAVAFKADVLEGAGTACQMGQLVKLLQIRRLTP